MIYLFIYFYEIGRLGMGDEQNYMYPVWINSLQGKIVKQVSCGAKHTAIVTGITNKKKTAKINNNK
jgi:hypothetical protein